MRLVACRKWDGPTLIEGKLAITSPTYSEYRFSEMSEPARFHSIYLKAAS
jgi:hypothetical protein